MIFTMKWAVVTSEGMTLVRAEVGPIDFAAEAQRADLQQPQVNA